MSAISLMMLHMPAEARCVWGKSSLRLILRITVISGVSVCNAVCKMHPSFFKKLRFVIDAMPFGAKVDFDTWLAAYVLQSISSSRWWCCMPQQICFMQQIDTAASSVASLYTLVDNFRCLGALSIKTMTRGGMVAKAIFPTRAGHMIL